MNIENPRFKLGDYVIVKSHDNPSVFVLGKIISGDHLPEIFKWRFFVETIIGGEPRLYYDDGSIILQDDARAVEIFMAPLPAFGEKANFPVTGNNNK